MTENASSTTNTTQPPTIPGSFNGVNFLLVTIYGGLAAIIVVLFTQRALLRLKQKFTNGYTNIGKNLPKSLKLEIENSLNHIDQLVIEPALLKDGDYRLRDLELEDVDGKSHANYIYRMKAIDDVKKIDRALEALDSSLSRPALKSLKQHLLDVKSHSSGVMRAVRTNQIILLADSYNHARYGAEKFGNDEFKRFSDILSDILESIGHTTHKTTKLKKQKSSSGHDHKRRTIHNSDKLPLLKEKSDE